MDSAGITTGTFFRSIKQAGGIWGSGFSPNVICGVRKQKAKGDELCSLAAHDLRRARSRLCHQPGDELEQIQFRLGVCRT